MLKPIEKTTFVTGLCEQSPGCTIISVFDISDLVESCRKAELVFGEHDDGRRLAQLSACASANCYQTLLLVDSSRNFIFFEKTILSLEQFAQALGLCDKFLVDEVKKHVPENW